MMLLKRVITAVVLLLSLLTSGANAQQQLRGSRKHDEMDEETHDHERRLDNTSKSRETSPMVYSPSLGGYVMAGSTAGSTTTTTTTTSNNGSDRTSTSPPGGGLTVNVGGSSSGATTGSTPTMGPATIPPTRPASISYNPACARVVNNASQCYAYEYPIYNFQTGSIHCVIPITDANMDLPGCPGRGTRSSGQPSGNPDLP